MSRQEASIRRPRLNTQRGNLFHREYQVAHERVDFVVPALAIEDVVVADIGLQMMPSHAG
jgi:hypothetical protein